MKQDMSIEKGSHLAQLGRDAKMPDIGTVELVVRLSLRPVSGIGGFHRLTYRYANTVACVHGYVLNTASSTSDRTEVQTPLTIAWRCI